MFKDVRISLANKCQLLFSAAVVVILAAALMVVAHRMQSLVERGARRRAQMLADAWVDEKLRLPRAQPAGERGALALAPHSRLSLNVIEATRFEPLAGRDPFIASAIEQFRLHPQRREAVRQASDSAGEPFYRYVRAIRLDDLRAIQGGSHAPATGSGIRSRRDSTGAFGPRSARGERAGVRADRNAGGRSRTRDARSPGAATAEAPPLPDPPPRGGEAGTDQAAATQPANPLRMLLLVQLRDPAAGTQAILNNLYLAAAGLFAGLLAIGVFWFITTRLILSPVRLLRDYAQQVSEGDLNTRSDINTGDEFEELSNMFNAMLTNIKHNEDKLRSINKSLDLKLGEMAESNVALYEANKMKGRFLANVSHELRTPLNSIIGFAEVLQETLDGDRSQQSDKRRRYTENIITSSRRLLGLITELLDLAKIEAGRMEVRPALVSPTDTIEGLINLIRPQAEAKRILVQQHIDSDLPMVRTDPGKLQQVLFNLLANAVKFTPEAGAVILSAAHEPPRAEGGEPTHIRFSVSDTGPGIDPEDQVRIFEQFTQLESGLDREQGGTGLGLTISRELAGLLQGRLELASSPEAGSTFTLILPLTMSEAGAPLMPQGGSSVKGWGAGEAGGSSSEGES